MTAVTPPPPAASAEPRSDPPESPAGAARKVTADALAERLLGSALGLIDLFAVYLGDRLGWYRSLADAGPATPGELASRTGTSERYAREWLEQQAVTGLLEVDGGAGMPGGDGRARQRRFSLPQAAAEVLTDEESLNYVAPMARMFAAVGPQLPALLEQYRTGGGVSWEQLGDDARESQADLNRPWFQQALPAALASIESVHTALSQPGARLADVGCGAGWSTIALAHAYPDAHVHGIDIDEPSVGSARANAHTAGVGDRVTFSAADASEMPHAQYTAAFAFECVHDMPRPVDVLAATRRSLVPGGFMVVMDEAVAEEFAPDGDDLERLMYGYSLLICLPDGLSSPPSVGTGTVMRPSTLRAYGEAAGFTQMEILPIEDFGFWRFYRLT
jgi:SAM-dependent methyltransferase